MTDAELKNLYYTLQEQKQMHNSQSVREQIYIVRAQLAESYSQRYKSALEEVFRKHPTCLDNVIKHSTMEHLKALTSAESERREIVKYMTDGKDILRGTVNSQQQIVWDDNQTTPMPTKEVFSQWVKDIFKLILPRISRKDPTTWSAFEKDITQANVINFENYPVMNLYGVNRFQNYGEYNELVILEMDMTDAYDEAMRNLRFFLYQCERTTKYELICKTLKKTHPTTGIDILEKMTGKNVGYVESFRNYLQSIPVKLVARKEVQI